MLLGEVVHLNRVPPDEVPLEDVVHPDEVPPLEEVVHLNKVPPDEVPLENALHLDEVPLDMVIVEEVVQTD